jgi:hypothetical protein
MKASLADQIERALADLEVLFGRADQEITRDDLPSEWDEDIEEADLAAQNCAIEVGPASNLNEDCEVTLKMLRRIDKWDEEQDA